MAVPYPFFVGVLGGSPEDLPSGRPQVRDRRLKFPRRPGQPPAGYEPEQQPVEIGGVRMFFVRDPDGTPVEFVSYPGGEQTSAQMWGYAE
jgi:catechol 2,3-dioxygenase-like lactoylglutathione lyase family enzyme